MQIVGAEIYHVTSPTSYALPLPADPLHVSIYEATSPYLSLDMCVDHQLTDPPTFVTTKCSRLVKHHLVHDVIQQQVLCIS